MSDLAAFSLGGDGLGLLSSLAVLLLVFDLDVGFSASFLSGLEIGSAREDAVLERVAFGMFVDMFWERKDRSEEVEWKCERDTLLLCCVHAFHVAHADFRHLRNSEDLM